MIKMTKDSAPRHLSTEAKTMWTALRSDYELDDSAGLALLRAACESFQRAEQARAAIAAGGAVVKDRFNQDKASPWCAIERDSRASMIAALRALRLAPVDAP